MRAGISIFDLVGGLSPCSSALPRTSESLCREDGDDDDEKVSDASLLTARLVRGEAAAIARWLIRYLEEEINMQSLEMRKMRIRCEPTLIFSRRVVG